MSQIILCCQEEGADAQQSNHTSPECFEAHHSERKHTTSQEEWDPHEFGNNNNSNRCGRQNKLNSAIWSLRRNNHSFGVATEQITLKEFQPASAGEPTSRDSWQRNTTCYNGTILNSIRMSAVVITILIGHTTRKKRML